MIEYESIKRGVYDAQKKRIAELELQLERAQTWQANEAEDNRKFRDRIAELERLNKVALEIIKELEWCETEYDPAHGHSASCPSCGGASKEGDLRHIDQEYGHYKDCELNNIIKEIEGSKP